MNIRTNLLKEIKSQYQRELTPIYGEEEANSMLNILINHFFNLSRVEQSLQPDFRLTETEILKLHFAVKELKKEKPVQYITGEAEFAGLTIKVTPQVLIPRPETEEMVEKIVAENTGRDDLKILDIGTGSGCIALALKKKLPESRVVAVDVSAEALKTADKNRLLNSVDVSFLKMDILDSNHWGRFGKFNIIVSNPPYVTESDKGQMQNNVLRHEPHLALFVPDDSPLLFYWKISEFASIHLLKAGRLWFEINERFGDKVAELLKNSGFSSVTLHRDIHGKARFVSCTKQ